MKMDVGTLRAILQDKITNSLGYFGGAIAKDRLKAMEYYYGQPFGNEVAGSSQVISRDVAEVVEAALPALLKIFASGDDVVRFMPNKPDDEQKAKQATDYANWVWNTQNPGFRIFHDWFKDALLQKLGVIKIWWDTETSVKTEHYRGLDPIQVQILQSDPDIEIVDLTETIDEASGVTLTDAKVRRTKKAGRIHIVPIPPEEFLVEHRAVDLDHSYFCGHRVRKTVTDLIEMGYDPEIVKSLPSEEGEYNMERLERFYKEDQLPYRNENTLDQTMREIWITECYIHVDYDGDGIAEYRKITVGGVDNYTILDNEEIDDHPFAALTPFLMPHKLFGMDLADFTEDIQLIKSTLWRQALDNMYLSNNPRLGVVDGQVNLDDLLTSRVGGIVRMKAPGMLEPVVVPNTAANALQMVEYVDSVRDKRTGIGSAYNQGLDSDVLNKTATGVAMLQDAGNQRLELIARVFAETGVKRAFRRILALACQHHTEAVQMRVAGSWVDIDPREWSDEYDITIEVGLGSGNKRADFAQAMQVLQVMQQIVGMQGGLNGPFVVPENVYNTLKMLVEAMGRKNVDSFFTDPHSVQMPPRPPPVDPKTQAALQKQLMENQQAQLKAMSEQEIARIKANADIIVQSMKAQHEKDLAAFQSLTR